MKRIAVFLSLLVLTAAFAFASGEAESESGAPVITVASDATWPPMEFVDADGQIVGFDIDLINAVAEAGGFEVEIQNTAWEGIFPGLANGDYDAVISSVTITDERKNTMDFSIPYVNAGQILVVPADTPASVTSLEDLAGREVGAQIGTTGAFAVEEAAGVELRTYDEIGLAVEDLANGRIAGAVMDNPVAADYVLQNENYAGRLKIVGEPFTEEFYGIAVKKGNTEVLDMINAGLEIVLNNGTADEITNAWLR